MAEDNEYKSNAAGGDNGEPENFRKIFVGGLTANTTDETMREFYAQFGDLTDIIVMRDPTTKRSRGFGFVTFAAKSMVDAAMLARPHVIDGKTVDPKRAVPKDDKNRSESNVSTKRLYVSGVREDHSEQMFSDYFSKFGTVVKAEIILDKITNKPRGFGFITFDDYDAVDQCVLQRSHIINNSRCDVKKGLSKDEMSKAQTQRDRNDRMGRSRGDQRGGSYGNSQSNNGGGWGASQRTNSGSSGYGGSQGGYGQGYGQQAAGAYGSASYGTQGSYGGYGSGYGEQAWQSQQQPQHTQQQPGGWNQQGGWGQGGQPQQQQWGGQPQGGSWGQSGAQQWANAQGGGGRY